ncbi:hypothetical protein RSAG8_11225, partial [Rhizoctonia solani AG-8 WAC10335]
MEKDLNFEELWKDPKFREFVSQYKKPLTTVPEPPSPSGALGSKSITEPCVNNEDDEDRGRSRTRDTLIPSTNKKLASRRSPSHRERSCSPRPKSSRPRREHEEFEGYRQDQVKQDYSSRRLRSTYARTSYTRGGKDGDRDGGIRGGPSIVLDKNGAQRKYKTFLEKMSKQEKYYFVKAHNHPFADVAGIPYFNPYGKVPLDNKLTAIIPKAAESLFISSGQRLDFPKYLEGRAVMRAAISCNIPDNATIEPGKSLSWCHFGLSVRLKVYEYVYDLEPYYYHFRDKTGENNWLIDSIAREYLKEYLRRHAAKSMKNKEILKSYIEEPDAENPYYFPKFGADKKYAGSTHALEGSTKHTVSASSSTNACDARRADRIVAQEEARANEELCGMI